MGNQLQALAEKFSTLGNTRAAAVEMLQAAKGSNGEQFDFSLKIPTLDETPAALDARVLAISELGKSIGIDDDATLIPRAYVSVLMNPLDSLIAQYASISDALKNIADNGGVGSLDLESFAIQNPNGQFRLDAKESFQRIRKLADGTLEHLYPLLHIVSAKGLADFSAAAHTYSQILEEIHQQRIELTSITT